MIMKKLLPHMLLLLSANRAKSCTVVDETNYAVAEVHNQFRTSIIPNCLKQNPGTDGVGVYAHARSVRKPKDQSIPRPNFDTLYSAAVLDLNTPAILTIPETDGRYLSVIMFTEDHFIPAYFINTKPGKYEITKENMGTTYVLALGRILVNPDDENDLEEARSLQNLLELEQIDLGTFDPTVIFDQISLEDMTEKLKDDYNSIPPEDRPTSAEMFGTREDGLTLENRNYGVATGVFGNPPERSIYLEQVLGTTGPYKLKIYDVPVRGFWSVTVYNPDGFVEDPELTYYTNTIKAKKEDDGATIINFVDGRATEAEGSNILYAFSSWTFLVRLYEPEEEILNGSWIWPYPKTVNINSAWGENKCKKKGCNYSVDGNESTCQRYDGNAEDYCRTIVFESECNDSTVCIWYADYGICKQLKCSKITDETDCNAAYDCKWASSKSKCVDLNKIAGEDDETTDDELSTVTLNLNIDLESTEPVNVDLVLNISGYETLNIMGTGLP